VGETQKEPFQLSFNGRLKFDFQGPRVTSDGGLLLVRELDERLGFGALGSRLSLKMLVRRRPIQPNPPNIRTRLVTGRRDK